ncbi:MAG: MMPL family transporter [Myxococcales bacterium]|nr:MMPL family transporter [Myxococcales bacterium]
MPPPEEAPVPRSEPRPPTDLAPSSGGAARRGPVGRAIDRLARLQDRHPFILLFVAALTVAGCMFLVLRLKLKASLGELLPSSKESVVIADRVAERMPSLSLLIVVAEGSDNEGLQRFVDAAAPELRKIDPKLVAQVDFGVKEAAQFFEDNRFLYAPLDLVQEVHDEVLDRYDYEVMKRADVLLDEPEPPPITEESIKKRIEERTKKSAGAAPGGTEYPDGYYLDPQAHAIAILLRTPLSSGDVDESRQLQKEVREALDRIEPTRFDPTIRIGFTGGLIIGAEDYEQIKNDLAHIGVWGVALILGVVLLYYMRLRTVLAMMFTVGVGSVWTFALAYLLVGYLNNSSGLLFSIVVGNGINFGIIYMARYMEARRTETAAHAIRTAHARTWLSTLAAAAAAATAYGSLVVTDFRGFKHFGIIGGTGMLLCWLATSLCLPAILVVSERIWPLGHGVRDVLRRWYAWLARRELPKVVERPQPGDALRALYGRPFAWIVERAPRTVTVIGVAIGVAALVLACRFVASNPIDYDLYNIRTAPKTGESEARRLNRVVGEFVSRQERNGLAVVTDRLDQVLPLKAALEARRDQAPPDKLPFSDVVTIHDLLPKDQATKIRLVGEVLDRIENAHKKRFITEEEYDKVRKYLPKKALTPVGIAELPEQLARNFEEKDGTRGRLVYIVPTGGRSIWDAHYLVEWADSIRATSLPDGSVVKASGSQVIFADMFLAVLEDAPKAIVVSLLATLALVVVTFRGRRSALWVLGTLGLGLACMVAVLALWPSPSEEPDVARGLRLNFLNFIALPITIGVGADYAINIVQRYLLDRRHPTQPAPGASDTRDDGRSTIARAVAETGGAVVLCSLTTTLGYLALTLSVNLAVRSFGIAAAVGEVSCLVAAVVVLPAALAWREARRRRAAHASAAVSRSGS